MSLLTLLNAEYASELHNTRRMLERVPDGHTDFVPHEKSMPFGRLVEHVTGFPFFASVILSTSAYDFGTTKRERLVFESPAQILTAFEGFAAKAQADLAAVSDEGFEETWKLTYNGQPIFSGTRFHAYRLMGVNHMIHHRAQLSVYLRLLNQPVPGIYGPSADEK